MKRVSKACQTCRSKHVKCNGRSPCARCIAHAELHNITPNEICFYPEPKKRGRPSASSSGHNHHSSSLSANSSKKKNNIAISSNTKTRNTLTSSRTSVNNSLTNTSTTHSNSGNSSNSSNICTTAPTLRHSNVSHPTYFNSISNQQQQKLQKSTISPSIESVLWNSNDSLSLNYTPTNSITQSQIVALNQMPISVNDIWPQNYIYYSDTGLFGNQQQSSRLLLVNPTTNNNNNNNNINATYYILNNTYNNQNHSGNTSFSSFNDNNFENNFSDSESPYNSSSSTPEFLPNWNTHTSGNNSPLLVSDCLYTTNNHITTDLLHTPFQEYFLTNYQQDTDLLNIIPKNEQNYSNYSNSNTIYPSMLDRNSHFIKTEENTNPWP